MIDGKTIADMEFLMETWNMNNGTDGFIDFYANHHPNCRYDEEQVESLLNLGSTMEAWPDKWMQEQYQRWFKNDDRFLTMFQYCAGDGRGLFTNWLQKIGKAQKVIEDIAGN